LQKTYIKKKKNTRFSRPKKKREKKEKENKEGRRLASNTHPPSTAIPAHAHPPWYLVGLA
jgi:hypothetical protein